MADNELANTDKTKYAVTLEEVCDHIGYLAEEVEAEESGTVKRNILRLIKFSDLYLQGAIGKNYPKEDERAKQIALLVISDLYDYRDLDSKKITNTTRKLLNDLEWQLKTEKWDKYYEGYAEVNKATGKEYFNAKTNITQNTYNFKLRYISKLEDTIFNTNQYRIIYKNNIFDIKNVDDKQEKRLKLTFVADCVTI